KTSQLRTQPYTPPPLPRNPTSKYHCRLPPPSSQTRASRPHTRRKDKGVLKTEKGSSCDIAWGSPSISRTGIFADPSRVSCHAKSSSVKKTPHHPLPSC